MWAALSCFRGFRKRTTKGSDASDHINGTPDSAARAAASLTLLVEASNLGAEWAGSQFPVACIALGDHTDGGTAATRRVTVLWHNTGSIDIWEKLTDPAINPALAEAMLTASNSQSPAQQVVLVPGSTFTVQPAAAQPAAAAARFTSDLLAAVSIPVHISSVQFSTGTLGAVVPRALLLVCRAPLMPPRHVDAGPHHHHHHRPHVLDPTPATATFQTATGSRRSPSVELVLNGQPQPQPADQDSERRSASIAAHRQRDSMVAAHLPAIITVYTLDGHVLHQNPASVQYMGHMPTARTYGTTALVSGPVTAMIASGPYGTEDGAAAGAGAGMLDSAGAEEGDWSVSGFGVLGLVFTLEQAKLRQMMDVLLGRGNIWQGIVRVPTSESIKQKLVCGGSAHQAPPLGPLAAHDTLRSASRPRALGHMQTLHQNHNQQRQLQLQQQQQEEDSVEAGRQGHVSMHAGFPSQQQDKPRPRWQQPAGQEQGKQQQRHRQRASLELQQQQPTQPPDGTFDGGGELVDRLGSPDRGRPGDPHMHAHNRQQQRNHHHNHQQQHPHHLHPPPPPHHHHHQQQQQQQQQSSQHQLAILDDGMTNTTTYNSSSSFAVSTGRQTRNSGNNWPSHQPSQHYQQHHYQQQPRPGSGAAITGEGLETLGSDGTAVVAAAHPGDMPAGRGATSRGSVANVYDAEADPLATSTWTVLADPASRGWPSNHAPLGRTLTNNYLGNVLRSSAPRISKRSRRSTALDSPGDGREGAGSGGGGGGDTAAAAAGAAAASLGLTRRWGSMSLAAGRGGPALPPGSVSGPQVGVGEAGPAVHYHSHPYTGTGLAPVSGPEVSGGTGDRKSALTGSGRSVASALAAASTVPLEGAAGPSSPPPPPWRERSHDSGGDGGGGGEGSCHSSATHVTVRRADGAPNIHSNPTENISSTNTTAAAAGISRVLVFANSLRSAPFATANASVVPVALPGPGGHEATGGGATGTGNAGGGGGSSAQRAQSTTTVRRQSKSYDRAMAAAATAPTPLGPRVPVGGDGPTVAAAAEPPPLALLRPDISALSALLRARRSSLVIAGPAPPPAAPADAVGPMAAATTTEPPQPAAIKAAPTPSSAGAEERVGPPSLVRQSTADGGGGGGSAAGPPTAVMITTDEAELAMALLPYSRSMAPSRAQDNPGDAAAAVAGSPGDGGRGGDLLAAAVAAERSAGGGAHAGGGGAAFCVGEHDVWHEISAVSALDPVTGSPVLVVTQVDVSAKVRAERHLVHVMCAERRLLLQLFPRHVLQAVVEANPLLHHSHSAAAAGAASLESLPREWLDGGDWRPVLRDCDKLATMHPQATVLFADIAGFDDICMELPPQRVLSFLNDLFAKFDNSIEPFGVHKMETIGGLFIVAGGLLREEEDGAVAVRDRWDPLHAEKVFMFAKAMLNVAANTKLPTLDQQPVKLRIGIHTGPVMSGIVGTRVPRFVLFGDTVNTASRMQTSATPGSVHVSEDTRALMPHENWTPTGGVQIKGKGLLNTYVWVPEDQIHYLVPPPASTPESTRTGGGGGRGGGGGGGGGAGVSAAAVAGAGGAGSGDSGDSSGAAAAAAAATAAVAANGSRHGSLTPAMLLSTMDTVGSCTSSDVFLAQQLSFTSALPAASLRGKSRLRNEGGFL